MMRLLSSYERLMESVIDNEQSTIGELDIVSEEEKTFLLNGLNNTAVDYGEHRCIHELIEQQAERSPDAIAVTYEDHHITYAELNARANRLAHYLKSARVKREEMVGICMDRSIDLIVGLVGIMKAGGAYVPVDPDYPDERIDYILEDARARVVITGRGQEERLRREGLRVVSVEEEAGEIGKQSDKNPASDVTASNLAYVIYTSGSTGKAKGVCVSHAAVCNHMLWMQQHFPLFPSDSILQKTVFTFDAAATEFYWPLFTGARLVVAKPGGHRDSKYMASAIVENHITVLQLVPSMLQVLLDEPDMEACKSLRQVFCGGEALSYKLQERFFAVVDAKLVNLYGPTEAAIDVSWWECRQGEGEAIVPIGYAIANTRLYVVDELMRVAPMGVPGELHIGGVGLARGYLKQAGMTAERFVPDVFGGVAGERLYKTGDLVRRVGDGEIEFLGRIDHQVKIRGFRIELGEIESVLRRHHSIKEAIVAARQDEAEHTRLVAYVLAAGDHSITPEELRDYLKTKLPEYMIPSAFAIMETLPLLPNGKVDRNALPDVELWHSDEKDFVGPRTTAQEVVALIWAKVIGVERVGIHDNFFDLGGHSLMATQIVSQLRKVFQVELSLRSLFEHPNVFEMAQVIERAIRDEQGLETPPIDVISRDGELQLSFAQQRLWFLNRLEPDSPAYNITAAVRLSGSLDAEKLEQSFNEVIKRHESLRTTFAIVEVRPVQVISPDYVMRLRRADLIDLPESEREAEVQRRIAEESQQAFSLDEGPLLCALLLKLREDEHIAIITMHHIVSDGWSMGILINEVATLYESFCNGKPSPLVAPPIQYVDFAHWQRQWLQGKIFERELGYWKHQLDGAMHALELPTDRARPATQTLNGASKSFLLPGALSDSFNRLSKRHGATLFMTLLAAFQTLLSRYSGQQDISVGTPIAGRNRAEIEGLVGFFVNTLVMRTDLSGDPSFVEVLNRVGETALGAYAHQDLPFERLVEELQPERDLSRTPLFQVMFVLQNAPVPSLAIPGLTLTPITFSSTTAKFDITLSLEETSGGLSGSLEYNTDLYNDDTIERMISRFHTLLDGIAADPEQRISTLPLLTQEERRQVLFDWNDTRVQREGSQIIHELFERQVSRTPAATALIYEGESLTYESLNRRANQLAHYLMALGVGPETSVAICVERSMEMVVGLLGILKAGGAYVPLDPTYPRERLAFMLFDAQSPVLLSQSRLIENLPDLRTRVVCLDRDWASIERESVDNPQIEIDPDNLAYTIYTSGSTGTPKGAMNTHRAVCNRLLWMQESYGLSQADRVLQKTPFSFDVSVWEFFWPLVTGAGLVVAPPGAHQDGGHLVRLIQQVNITTLHFVPSMLRVFLQEGGLEACESLKRVICSGEALSVELRQSFFERMDAQLHNLYGPTEASIDVTSWVCSPEDDMTTVPIGRPIANTQILILDDHLQPVPCGIVGELHIGGMALGRGYFARPDLTAERFIPNPFGQEPGARLFKTSDLARHMSDGSIEYLGRMDYQVKIRGLRIELGEIEAALSQHPAIQDAVVVAKEYSPQDRRLIAYVVLNQLYEEISDGEIDGHAGQEWTSPDQLIRELRTALKERLPDYMIPSAFVMLDAFPLMPNGKLNRNALPRPEGSRSETEADFITPQTDLEQTIADVWRTVLKVDRVGIYNNFFELGGHSLLIIDVHIRLQKILGQEFSVIEMFRNPTIHSLAACLGQEKNDDSKFRKTQERARKQREAINRQKHIMSQISMTKTN
jgi:amino acid adenylation domain-containing protein